MRNVTYVSPLFDSFNFIAHSLYLTFSGVRIDPRKAEKSFSTYAFYILVEASVSFIAADKRVKDRYILYVGVSISQEKKNSIFLFRKGN